MMELEIIALAGMNERNHEQLSAHLDEYRNTLFPGQEKPKDDFIENAKRALAEEAKKVYIVRSGAQAGRDALKRAMQSADPNVQKWAAQEMQKQSLAQQRLDQRLSRGKK